MENINNPESNKVLSSYKNIVGWGYDADPDNEPTYPMKHYNGADHDRLNYDRPVQQVQNEEILMSIERPRLSSVFGTASPPSGLSGMLRRFAFQYSESTYSHWVPLVLADRINAIEGIIQDLSRGHIPNIFAERGLKSEFKYNRRSAVQNVLVGVLVASALIVLLSQRKKKKKDISDNYFEV